MAEESGDNTVVATAKEGEALIETKGKADEDVKARAQQKGIEEIATEEDKAEAKRTTMEETAKEGKELLDGEELGKTRSQTKNEAKNGEDAEPPEENGEGKGDDEEEPDTEQNGNHAEDEKSPAKRTRANDGTAQEGEEVKKPRVEAEDEEVKT